MTLRQTATRSTRRRQVAVLLSLSGFLLYVLTSILVYRSRTAPQPPAWTDWYSGLLFGVGALVGLLLGAVLIARRQAGMYGWVWVVNGLATILMNFLQAYAVFALLLSPETLPFGWLAAYAASACWFTVIATLPLILLLFPTGSPPTRRWRIVLWGVFVILGAGLATFWTVGVEGFVPVTSPRLPDDVMIDVARFVADVAVSAAFLAIPVGVISLLHRYRLAGAAERQQLKWFAYGAVIFVLVLGSDFLWTAPGAWEAVKEGVAFAILPVVIAIAILRNHLWDIDIVIRKTLLYTVLSALLAVLFFGSVILLQRIFEATTGQQSQLAIVLSTLAIAALFSPLRRRIQDWIDRRFYRKKYDAQQVLTQFALTARDETDMNALAAELAQVVAEALQPERVSIWLQHHDASARVGAIGHQPDSPE